MKVSLKTALLVTAFLPLLFFLLFNERLTSQRWMREVRQGGNLLLAPIPVGSRTLRGLEVFVSQNYVVLFVFNESKMRNALAKAQRLSKHYNLPLIIDVQCHLSGKQLTDVFQVPSTQFLFLPRQDFTSPQFDNSVLRHQSALVVDITGSKISPSFLESVASSGKLAILDLSETNLEDEWFSNLGMAQSKMFAPNVVRTNFGDNGCEWCARSKIVVLDARATRINSLGIKALVKSTYLKVIATEIRLDHFAVGAIAKAGLLREVYALSLPDNTQFPENLVVSPPPGAQTFAFVNLDENENLDLILPEPIPKYGFDETN